jgi:ligand-binding SRPBCC domain-containing protein
VELELHFVFYRQKWVSRITNHDFSAKKYRFTDEGVVLPSPFKRWKHQHVITDSDSFRLIRDQIEYHSANRIMDLILYPFVWFLFYYRKAVYQKIFGQMN